MKLPESFLHFVWDNQLFASQSLKTTEGTPLQVIDAGTENTNAGADFEAAQLRIGEQHWAGNIEIHILPQEWYLHRHHTDPAYDNVILHVVWEDADNIEVRRSDGSLIPTLVLCDRVPKRVVLQYESFLNAKERIPCQTHFSQVPESKVREALEYALQQRLTRKSNEVLELLHRNQNDWEETFYQLLGKGFGLKVNADPFLDLTRSLPLKLLQKHRNNPLQVEALLLGQAGFLEDDFTSEYPRKLQAEYRFLAQKYQLGGQRLAQKQWKRSRVRPGNTPIVRLLQFGALLRQHQSLFSFALEAETIKPLLSLFDNRPTAYWEDHRKPDKLSKSAFPKMGRNTREVILLNTLIPTFWAYGWRNKQPDYQDKAQQFLRELRAEDNQIIRFWKEDLKLQLHNAADTQAGLELYNESCQKKHCLRCPVGAAILLSV